MSVKPECFSDPKRFFGAYLLLAVLLLTVLLLSVEESVTVS